MADFMSTKQAADKWGISSADVGKFCREGLIEGAFKDGNLWCIPINAEKPVIMDADSSYPEELGELRKLVVKEINNRIKELKKGIKEQEGKIDSNYIAKNSVTGGLGATAARNASDKRIEHAKTIKSNYEYHLKWFEKMIKIYK